MYSWQFARYLFVIGYYIYMYVYCYILSCIVTVHVLFIGVS